MIFDNLLCAIDLFGTPLTINYCGKEKSKSRLGGICSLMLLFLVGLMTYNSSQDFFSKSNPKMITSESYVESPPEMSISSRTFPLAFALQAPDNLLNRPFADESIFKLKIAHTLIERSKNENGTVNEKWTITDLATERCTPEHFGELYDRFAILDLQFSYCIARDQPEIKLEGAFENFKYQSLDVKVVECDNKTSNISCSPQEVIDSYLSGSWFNALYTNMVIDPKNFSRPESRFRDFYYTMISPANYKFTEIELGHVELTTDVGWLIESTNVQNYIKPNKIKENLQFKPNPEKVLIQCTFQASKLEQSYLRSYKKVQNILAEVGGLANALMTILVLLTTHYLKLKVRISLSNELFNLFINKREEKQISRSNNTQICTELERQSLAVKNKMRNQNPKRILEMVKPENKKRKNLETLDKKICNTSQVLITMHDTKAGDLDERLKEGLEDFKESNIKEFVANIKEPNSDCFKEVGFSCIKNDTSPQLPDKDTFRNLLTSERSSSRDPNYQIKEEVVTKKVKALQPKFKVLEEPEEENPPNPSLILDNFPGNYDQVEKIEDLEERGIDTEIKHKEINKKRLTEQETNITRKSNFALELTGIKEFLDENKANPENKNESSKNKSFQQEGKTLDLSIWEYICSLFYKSKSLKQKMNLISEGINKTNERLDMLNILKKLREVDKLKALLLNYDQLIMFNNLPKPEIGLNKLDSYQSETSFSSKLLRKSTFVERSHTDKQILEAYERVRNNNQQTKIDQKLLKIFLEKDL